MSGACGRRRVPGFSLYEVPADGSSVYSRSSRAELGLNFSSADGRPLEPPQVWAYEDRTGRMRRVAVAELVSRAFPERGRGEGEEEPSGAGPGRPRG